MKILYFNDFRLGVLRGNDTVIDVMDVVSGIPHTGPHNLISGLIEKFSEFRPRLEKAASEGVSGTSIRSLQTLRQWC